jgi:hypothetical protein
VGKIEKIGLDVGERRHTSAIQKVKGDLLMLGGDETAAEESYLDAISTAQEQSARLLELEAVKRLAYLWQRQGKTWQAREKLQEVYDWFTDGFDTPMLIEARELLKDLASQSNRTHN